MKAIKKLVTAERVQRVIILLLDSPNESEERVALWYRLIKLRNSLS
jgi:hypothetical protein